MQTSPRPFAFVLMPFSRSYDDVYELAISAACVDSGAYAERVDKQIFSGNILDRVFNQIAKADLIIADMSERNANVFYEVGYAHALGKTTILLTRNDADIPFDLKHYPHIVYGDSLTKLKSELTRSLRWHIENPTGAVVVGPDLLVRVNDIEVTGYPTIKAKMRGAESSIRLQITFKNRSSRAIRPLTFRVGLSVPLTIVGATCERSQPLLGIVDENHQIFSSPSTLTLLPEQLEAIHYRLTAQDLRAALAGERYDCCIRTYLESGALEYAFALTVSDS